VRLVAGIIEVAKSSTFTCLGTIQPPKIADLNRFAKIVSHTNTFVAAAQIAENVSRRI